jgi:hypothetical protein
MKTGEKISIEELKQGRILDCKELLSFFQAHKSLFWSWGAHAFMKMTESCLRMKVNGHHHKGHVYIFLNAADTFDVYLTSTQGKILQIIEGLYIDQIFNVLDERIEKIAAYKV